MTLETCQLLCFVWHVLDPEHKYFDPPYKLSKSHKNHPCAIWARESESHYVWLCKLGLALCKEYTRRYDREHKCESYIKLLDSNIPPGMQNHWVDPPQAMPDEYKHKSSIIAYRRYYKFGKKTDMHKWKNSQVPFFMKTVTVKMKGCDNFAKSLM